MKFNSEPHSVMEGEEAYVCLIFETERLKKVVHLSVVSHSDTANFGEDYSMPSMFSIILKPGDNQSCFAVDTVEDDLVEGDETFQLILTSSDQAVVISINGTLTVHIEDNDGKPASSCHSVIYSCLYARMLRNYYIICTFYMVSCCIWFGCCDVHSC